MENPNTLGPISGSGPGTICLRPELRDLKIIGVEEHVAFPELLKLIPRDDYLVSTFQTVLNNGGLAYAAGRRSAGEQRIKDMDEGHIAFQVLSLSGAIGVTFMAPQPGYELSVQINNELKKAVEKYPTRFAALAELPMQDPDLAVKELHRCIKELGFVGAMMSGSIGASGRYLDGPEYDPVLAAFEELDVPLYLHPGVVPKPVMDTYYSFPEKPLLSATFAHMGWGWHNEVAIHLLRLVLSGALERHPRLKIIVGHQGEMLPMMIQRFDTMFDQETFGYKRSVGEMLRSQVWVAISGLFTLPPTLCTIATWGVDKVLFANDYPFIDTQRVPEFVRALGDVLSPADLRKVCQKNAEQLFKITV
jgi:predicted TIM-barrel fold metal-dependent hydrolase